MIYKNIYKNLFLFGPNVYFFLPQMCTFSWPKRIFFWSKWYVIRPKRETPLHNLGCFCLQCYSYAFSLSSLHITTLVCRLSYSSKSKKSVFHFLVCSDNNLIVSICVCIFFLFRRFNKIQQHSKLWNVSIMKCGLDLRRCILIFGICCYFIPRRCISFKVLT